MVKIYLHYSQHMKNENLSREEKMIFKKELFIAQIWCLCARVGVCVWQENHKSADSELSILSQFPARKSFR